MLSGKWWSFCLSLVNVLNLLVLRPEYFPQKKVNIMAADALGPYFVRPSSAMVLTTRLILGLHPANMRRCYKVTPSLIGWAQI